MDRLTPSWKILGKDITDINTAKEAMIAAGLDYEVALGEVYVKYDEWTEGRIGTQAGQVPDTFATYRTDNGKVFGAVGSRYEVVQNTEVFKFFDIFIENNKATFETVGMLGGGATVYITAELSETITVAGMPNEEIKTYILLINSHDGSSSVQCILTPMRIKCWNMLPGIGLDGNGKILIRHTQSAHAKIDETTKIMDTINGFVKETSRLYSELAAIKVTDTQVKDLYRKVFLTDEEYEYLNKLAVGRQPHMISTRKRNLLTDINYSYNAGLGQDEIKGTMYGAVNGLVHYFQNMKNYANEEKKMSSIFMGGRDAKYIAKAVEVGMTYKQNI